MAETYEGHHGPCPWPYDEGCCNGFDPECVDETVLERAKAIAQDVLWRASGRRFGLCEITVRPCRDGCRTSTWGGGAAPAGNLLQPYLANGVWKNCGGSCGDCGECRCCNAGCHEVPLVGPVQDVLEVKIGGTVLPRASYRVDDHRWLVREDGVCWPDCSDLSLPEEQAWTVTYRYGLPLGPAGVAAYSAYVCEIYKACTGQECRLPANVEGVFRQGINIDFQDRNLDLLSGARTGIPDVDRWLAGVNPYGIKDSAKVYSPDLRRPRVTTWHGGW